MRLAKLSQQKQLKATTQKYEQNEWAAKGQMGGFGKRLSGTLSILSSNNSGSCRSIGASAVNTSNIQQRPSFGNGSCISSSSTNNSCPNKRRKSKAFKCFSSTVFRCCLPCRGGSSPAAPATSPPHTPVQPSATSVDNSSVKRKRSAKSSIEISEGTDSFVAAAAAVVKKHSLADTIGTSATTPISLKTLINDVEELDQQISAADIAAASLASGILPRRAEPETLSDTSISPTVAALQTAAVGGSASASSLLSTTTSLLSVATAAGGANSATAAVPSTQSSPTTPPNPSTAVSNQTIIVGSVANATVATASGPTTSASASSTGTTSTPSRCCCPPPQTSPLPHIKEEEESEQLLNRQHSVTRDDESTAATDPTSESHTHHQQQQQPLQQFSADQLSPYAANPSGSSDSCTSLSANAATISSTTGCTTQDFTTSTPSPRIKHKFRKQHKSGWSRIVLAPSSVAGATSCGAANSSETLASSSINSSSAATVGGAHTRLTSSSASALGAQQSNSSQLLPASKMQAEQGSIGDLQKYHSRYLKNRRHTLANVR